MALTQRQQEVLRLEVAWARMARDAGVGVDVRDLFSVWHAEDLRGVEPGGAYYLDMNPFVHYETGRVAEADSPAHRAPLGEALDEAEHALRDVFRSLLPRMRQLAGSMRPAGRE